MLLDRLRRRIQHLVRRPRRVLVIIILRAVLHQVLLILRAVHPVHPVRPARPVHPVHLVQEAHAAVDHQ